MDVPRVTEGWSEHKGLGWRPVKHDDIPTAMLQCSNGHRALLSTHQIAADGTVTPSAVCPYEGCNFHEWIRLAGWEEAA
jgi:hypothetical protein